MSGPEIISASAPVGSAGDAKETAFIKVQNEDELRLAQMGHRQELDRHFSLWSLIGLAANCNDDRPRLGFDNCN